MGVGSEIAKLKLPRAKLCLDDFGVTLKPFRLFVLYQLLNIFWFSGIPFF
jgi:hypothetical protein